LLLSSHDGLPLPGHSARAAQEQKSGICPLKISCLFTNKRLWIGNDLYNNDLHVVVGYIFNYDGISSLKLWKSMSETQSCDLHMLKPQVSGRNVNEHNIFIDSCPAGIDHMKLLQAYLDGVYFSNFIL